MSNTTPTSLDRILCKLTTGYTREELLSFSEEDTGLDKSEVIEELKAVDNAVAAITALLPEKYPPDSGFKKDEGYYHDVGFNEAINTIQRNFTGQTDNERKQ